VETTADEQRSVVAAVAEVGVARAAFELDTLRHLAAQAEVEEVAVVIGVQPATRVHADLEVADAAHQVELLGETVVPAEADGSQLDVDAWTLVDEYSAKASQFSAKPIEPRSPKPSAEGPSPSKSWST
jgi:hypothetical protein